MQQYLNIGAIYTPKQLVCSRNLSQYGNTSQDSQGEMARRMYDMTTRRKEVRTMKKSLTRTDCSGDPVVSRDNKTRKSNAQLHIRMFLLMAALFAILYGVLTAVGHFTNITSTWFYVLASLAIMGLEYLIGPFLVGAAMRVNWVSEQEEPELHRMVAELAYAAHLPKPKVGISQISIPSVFAYGRTQKDGRICITRGLRDLLSANELRAVLGHEMSHIRNRDMIIITLLSAIPMILYNIGRGLMPSNSGDSDSDSGQSVIFALAVFIVFFVLYFITELLVLYGSRIREYYADRGSIRLGNEPRYLAAALYRLTMSDNKAKTGTELEGIEHARAFLFSDPSVSWSQISELMQIRPSANLNSDTLFELRNRPVKLGIRKTLVEVFSTHPDVLKRIKALSEL
jgi:heat shock protein HtpX